MLNIIYDGPPSGKRPSQGDELETDLDMEWAGSVAKGATIDVVVSESTNTTAGVDLSALYIVDNNLAPVMSESYGACELDMGTAGNLFYNQLWQQAAAEGITVFVSTGDSGSAVCDRGSEGAMHGLAVNGVSSTPYNIAVGGTDFDDLQDTATYWSSTNNPATYASALSYIPERTWNDTCTNSEFFSLTGDKDAESDCNDSSSGYWPYFLNPVGGSGGASNCTTSTDQSVSSCGGGYAKPSWQTGTGVPADRKRDVPDVSLFAGNGLNASVYLVCETDIYAGCQGSIYSMVGVGGTSASAPAFAGIMAMINQKTQSRQGNANYVFYPLAAQPGASCNSSGPPGSSCIFNDVTVGTVAMPCVTGSPNCVTNTPSDQYGVLSGYDTTAGYDLATGLGSVNIANLVNNWETVSFQPTVSTLSLNPRTNIKHGSPVNLNLTVAPQTGTGTPTGLVSLLTSAGPSAGTYTLADGSVTATTSLLPGGSYTVTTHYAGDGTFGASDSLPGIPVTVNSEPSTTILQAFTLDQNGNETPFTSGVYGGNYVYLRASVAGESGEGAPTGNVILSQTLNGTTTKLPGDPYSLNSEAYILVGLPGTLNVGTYSMSGQYTGDASFKASASPAVGFTIKPASTNLTTNIFECSSTPPCLIIPGTEVTILGTVLTNSSGFADSPTGTMTFYSNGTPLGPSLPVSRGVNSAVASLTTTLPLGVDNITEQYSGDASYIGSTSDVSSVDVGAGIAISANPTAIMIASPGQSGSTVLTFTAQNGFTGTANLSPANCSFLPPKSSCSFSSQTLTFTSSTTSVPVTLTITTTAPTTALLRRVLPLPTALGFIFLISIGIGRIGAFRRFGRSFVAFVVLAVIALTFGCGGGGSGGVNSPPPTTIPGTPVGNYTGLTVSVTITGITGTINNLSANVQ
jgi:subtilase family serine protease